MSKYSYSRLEVFKQCPYKYKIMYLDGHYIQYDSIATKFGSLIHLIEEEIGNAIKNNEAIGYDHLIAFFDREILKLKEEFKKDFYELDKSGRTYEDKALYYRNEAIYRLERRVKNEKLTIVDCEKEFTFKYNDITFHGFIDRIFKKDNYYIIEDIKTYNLPLPENKLTNPLQFIIYELALKDKLSNNIVCKYDLPLCNIVQPTIINNLDIDSLLEEIDKSDFHPCPSPLCYWCIYSETFPSQPAEAKGLCPYYSLWTKEHKTKKVNIKWKGKDEDKIILEEFKKMLK